MSVIGSNILAGSSGAADAYTIDQSLRFNDDDSAYLGRTFSAGDTTEWTFSCWTKRGNNVADGVSGAQKMFGAMIDGSNVSDINFWTGDTLYIEEYQGGSYAGLLKTTAVYRDYSAWYHIVVVWDSDNVTSGDRYRLYVNGDRVTDFVTETQPTSGRVSATNAAGTHYVGKQSTDEYYDGYLAEMHFIDGTALDASSFGETDSTTNQWKPIEYSGSYGTNGFYQKYASTVLADSFEDSANHTAHTVTANGDVHTDTTVKKIGTASAQFDGDGDYLSVASSSDFGFGDGDFTIELWFYRTASGAYPYILDGRTAGGGEGDYPTIYLDSDDSYKPGYYLAGSSKIISSATTTTDTWYHLAIVRSSTTTTMYLDGSSVGTWSDSTTYATCPLTIGDYSTLGTYEWTGYMDEIRISNTARYVSSFTPSTTEFTADKYTRLLLHCDGADSGTTFTDSSWTGAPRHIITANGGATNTRAQSKVGDSSMVFDGTGDYLSSPDSTDWGLNGTGDFTVEFWVRLDDVTATDQGIVTREDASAADGWGMPWQTGGLGFQFRNPGTNLTTGTTGVVNDTWYHVAACRYSGTIDLYLDGVSKDSVSNTTDMDDNDMDLVVGRFYSNSDNYYMSGYVDEIRISNTARYPDGTTFTPQTTAFTADSNTKLLIHSNWTGGLGTDSSGNGNVFAVTNLVATDQMKDSPTNNFCTLNAVDFSSGSLTDIVLAEGNLKYTNSTSSWGNARATFGMTTGKWYFEGRKDSGPDIGQMGVCNGFDINQGNGNCAVNSTGGIGAVWDSRGYIYRTGASVYDPTGNTFTSGDIISCAFDVDTGEIWWAKNGVWHFSGDPAAGTTPKFTASGFDYLTPLANASSVSGTGWTFNFGQDSSFHGLETAQGNQDDNEIGDFYYEPPTDFLALCTSNLPDPSIADPTAHFNTVLYTGNSGVAQSITGVGFEPDAVWLKRRNYAGGNHCLFDQVRGANISQHVNSALADITRTDALDSFDSDGFTLGADTGTNVNYGAYTYASWNWKGDGVAGGTLNQDGTVDSQVNVNTTAGFSIVTYTGTGSDDGSDNVGHGLAQTPEFYVIKNRSGTDGWNLYTAPTGTGNYMTLNNTIASTAASNGFQYNTTPTASVFTLGTWVAVNELDDEYLALCFHSVEGYSKIGSYVGNGDADGPFVYTGFKPAYTLIKMVTDSAQYWEIGDNKINPYNPTDYMLLANTDGVEVSGNTCDYLSNGFKVRLTGGSFNLSGKTYLFYSVAESPFKTANAR
jgi:hypothetical protein